MTSPSSSTSSSQAEVSTVDDIRSQFPALQRSHNGFPVAYFDGPGGTQVPRQVVESMADYLYHHNANTHWAYPTSAETDAAIERARVACADFVNASPTEIAFGANMTTLTMHLSRALGLQWRPGDEIVVTELDHHANIDPWLRLRRERGVDIRIVRMNAATGELDNSELESSINSKTKLVALGAASNALGTVNDFERVIRLAKGVGALTFIDAVHYAPHFTVDVQAIDCDFLAMSAYKFYGPHIGVIFGKRSQLERIDFPRLIPAPDYPPEIMETGTQNQEGMVGTAAAVDFLASLSTTGSRRDRIMTTLNEIHRRNLILTQRLWDGLNGISGVRIYGPGTEKPRTPTISFTIDGVASTNAARLLAERGLFLSHGDFYAATVVKRLGLEPEGLLRAGCACYTTLDEVERLIDGVNVIATAG